MKIQMQDKLASILIKQYSQNSNSTFTFEKHSTLYIFSERSYRFLGFSRVWIEVSRSTQYSRKAIPNLRGIKRIRPIGEKTIEDCFRSINIDDLCVEIHDDEIYVSNADLHKFIIRCFMEFYTEAFEYDKRKYGDMLKRKRRFNCRGIQ